MAATRLIAMHVNKGKSIGQCLKDRTSREDLQLTKRLVEAAKLMDMNVVDHVVIGGQNGQYVSAYACDPETVDQAFLLSKKEYLRITGRQIPGDIIAYQIRQSFKPGEVSAEEANKIGYETAMRFTHGEHAFIVATHTDRAHIQPIRTARTSTITSSLIPPISPATGNLRTAGSSPSRCRN